MLQAIEKQYIVGPGAGSQAGSKHGTTTLGTFSVAGKGMIVRPIGTGLGTGEAQ
jgi:hypothetical protein